MFPAVLTPDYIFTFGKHKGSVLENVILEHPGYIRWLRENVPWFSTAFNEMIELNRQVREDVNIAEDEMVNVKVVTEVDVSWFERMGGNYNDRGRV